MVWRHAKLTATERETASPSFGRAEEGLALLIKQAAYW